MAMRNIYRLALIGPSFTIGICTIGVIFLPENNLDGIMSMSIIALVINLVIIPFIKCKKMIQDELREKRIRLSRIDYDLKKWEEKLIENAKNKLWIPWIGWLGFFCFITAYKTNWEELSLLKLLPLGLSVLAVMQIIFILTENLNPKSKKFKITVM